MQTQLALGITDGWAMHGFVQPIHQMGIEYYIYSTGHINRIFNAFIRILWNKRIQIGFHAYTFRIEHLIGTQIKRWKNPMVK